MDLGVPLGKVQVKDGKKVLATVQLKNDSRGNVVIRLKKLKPGKHKLVVVVPRQRGDLHLEGKKGETDRAPQVAAPRSSEQDPMSSHRRRRRRSGAPTAPGPRPAPLRAVLAFLLLASVFGVLVRIASLPLINNDTYFHLRFGHEFLASWSLRHPGSVSTFATQEWVPTQWLPQLVMAKAEDVFGLAGVAWLSGLQFLSLALALYVACRRHAEPLVSVFLVMLTLVACTPGMSMRPQQISYLMVVITVSIWLGVRDSGRTPWLLVPLTWIWTMCHGMWPVGIVIGFAAVVGLALDGGRSPGPSRSSSPCRSSRPWPRC